MILTSFHITRKKIIKKSPKKLLTSQMADSEKAPEQQQQAPAKTEGSKNDNASNPPASEEQQPKQIIGEFKKNKTQFQFLIKKKQRIRKEYKIECVRTRQLIIRFNAIIIHWDLNLIRCFC